MSYKTFLYHSIKGGKFVKKIAYSQKEAAEALGVCKDTILKLIREGKLVAQRPSPRRVIISADSLREYMNDRS